MIRERFCRSAEKRRGQGSSGQAPGRLGKKTMRAGFEKGYHDILTEMMDWLRTKSLGETETGGEGGILPRH